MSRQLRRSCWLVGTASLFAVACGSLSAGAAAGREFNPTQAYASPYMMRSTGSFAPRASAMSVYESYGYASPYFSLGRVCITRVPVYRYGNFVGFRCSSVGY
jgi:hypothetical protein